jgi:hypothetical protein
MVLKTEVRVVLVHKEADDIKIAIFQVLWQRFPAITACAPPPKKFYDLHAPLHHDFGVKEKQLSV